ncbi:MAG: hypothetical protein P0Y50_14150 [Candidatus Brevundimonas colombiensis]|uniref:Uncharacterized protein n=1 Tax=Candidatus Brevundimonas colombiensis TaxID=3121376 RepID=A0AAJ5X0G2_9CAUL|nr:hypothetical protein [Brevundimonas sp.]WEK39659.1 MAG: hypothetical protein P0Y50_14150 [Brevundimonas sp.]
MLLSIMVGEALYIAHRCRRALLASPVVLACAATAMALFHHGPVSPHG